MQTSSAEFTKLPIDQISVQDGFNPRKFFDNYEFQQLVVSVQAEGVIQPIIVRSVADGNGYWVVAGERRWRAANEAGLTEIPAVVRNLSDREARLIATVENSQRADMSPAEEAVAARDVLTDCGGDKSEALRLLGWSGVKFDARLLLLHAASEVLNALTERKIKLGHAELLSQLPSDFQTATLAKILENGYSVAELKSRLASFALELSKATFDKTGCNGCPHNSSMQSSLFEEHISEGRCANRACYEQKTETAMLEKKASLSEQYAAVFLDTERRPDSYKIICQSGAEGVGKAQLEQGCKQCAHFGALLSTSSDRLGRITEDCCFNLDCHKDKVVGYQESFKAASTPASNDKGKASTKKSTKPIQSVTGRNPDTSNNDADEKEGDTGNTSAAIPPTRVIEKIEAFYRDLGAKQITDNKLAVLCVNTFALYRLVRSSLPVEKMPESLKDPTRIGCEIEGFVKALSSLGIEETLAFNHRLLSHLLGEHEKSTPILNKTWAKGAASVLNVTKARLADHFILDREFLGSFTKAGIEGVLREAINGKGLSFVEHYEKQSEKHKIAALMKKKNNEILDDVLGCGYDFAGFVPSCVFKFMGDDSHQDMTSHTQTPNAVVEPVSSEPTTESQADEADVEVAKENGAQHAVEPESESLTDAEDSSDQTDFEDLNDDLDADLPRTDAVNGDDESAILDAVIAKTGEFDDLDAEESSSPSNYLSDSDWLDDEEKAMSLNANGYTQDPEEEAA
ncbi:MAG: PRTRC system ParB family protein [Methylicorpusculum sp.]|uniref:PRTRC system ParB family protein n=1 Tax=Methylicorpusculum TaxID=2713642 RepID=UPI00135A642D|nr:MULTISPECIES: PRTRC system ParB family protein [Methylicorpusculum]MCD2451997.1 PRTRC system ParB family protein [Methylicorpusculum oleiharenae]MDP2203539.1 PRTRC system ParB family protein [Methylicorpusculum sp.]